MSNYPPGVTGRELEIAGPDWEGEVERMCEEEDVELEIFQLTDMIKFKKIAAVKGAQGAGKARDADVIQSAMRRALSRTVTVPLPGCVFSGSVDAWMYDGVLHWCCPMCGTDHEENQRDE